MPENIPSPPSPAEAKANYNGLSPEQYTELGVDWRNQTGGNWSETGAPAGRVAPAVEQQLTELSTDRMVRGSQVLAVKESINTSLAPEAKPLSLEEAKGKYNLSMIKWLGTRDRSPDEQLKAKQAVELTLLDLVKLQAA